MMGLSMVLLKDASANIALGIIEGGDTGHCPASYLISLVLLSAVAHRRRGTESYASIGGLFRT
jgi:hypothetical protein